MHAILFLLFVGALGIAGALSAWSGKAPKRTRLLSALLVACLGGSVLVGAGPKPPVKPNILMEDVCTQYVPHICNAESCPFIPCWTSWCPCK